MNATALAAIRSTHDEAARQRSRERDEIVSNLTAHLMGIELVLHDMRKIKARLAQLEWGN